MRKILLTLVFLCFVIPTSFARAGGDTVGNGGGLAEIRLTKLWANLSKEIAPCLNTLFACGAYPDVLAKVVSGIAEAQKCKTKLKFKVLPVDQSFARSESCSVITVNQKFLYVKGKTPKSHGELLALALKMVGYPTSNEISDNDVQEIAGLLGAVRLFSEAKVRGVSHKLLWLASNPEDLITIESDKALVTLNRHLYGAVACTTVSDFKMKSLQIHSSGNSGFELRGTFDLKCGANQIIRSFKMLLPVNEDSQILEDFIEITFN